MRRLVWWWGGEREGEGKAVIWIMPSSSSLPLVMLPCFDMHTCSDPIAMNEEGATKPICVFVVSVTHTHEHTHTHRAHECNHALRVQSAARHVASTTMPTRTSAHPSQHMKSFPCTHLLHLHLSETSEQAKGTAWVNWVVLPALHHVALALVLLHHLQTHRNVIPPSCC